MKILNILITLVIKITKTKKYANQSMNYENSVKKIKACKQSILRCEADNFILK